jgi:hypothetical protein
MSSQVKRSLRAVAVVLFLLAAVAPAIAGTNKDVHLSVTTLSQSVSPAPAYYEIHFYNVVRGSNGMTYTLHRVRKYFWDGWADIPDGTMLSAVVKGSGMQLTIPLQNGRNIKLWYQIVSQEPAASAPRPDNSSEAAPTVAAREPLPVTAPSLVATGVPYESRVLAPPAKPTQADCSPNSSELCPPPTTKGPSDLLPVTAGTKGDSAVPSGSIQITSTPESAGIYVDDAFVGNCPALLHLTTGKHTLRFTLAGYRESTLQITVLPNSESNVIAILDKR